MGWSLGVFTCCLLHRTFQLKFGPLDLALLQAPTCQPANAINNWKTQPHLRREGGAPKQDVDPESICSPSKYKHSGSFHVSEHCTRPQRFLWFLIKSTCPGDRLCKRIQCRIKTDRERYLWPAFGPTRVTERIYHEWWLLSHYHHTVYRRLHL